MPTLADLVRDRTALSVADAEWLHLLVGDWQLLSDLSFADLVLWLPEISDGADSSAWVAGAHVRPVTGPMVFFEDQVGIRVERGRRVQIDTAYDESRIVRERDPDWNDDDIPVREEAIPVVRSEYSWIRSATDFPGATVVSVPFTQTDSCIASSLRRNYPIQVQRSATVRSPSQPAPASSRGGFDSSSRLPATLTRSTDAGNGYREYRER